MVIDKQKLWVNGVLTGYVIGALFSLVGSRDYGWLLAYTVLFGLIVWNMKCLLENYGDDKDD